MRYELEIQETWKNLKIRQIEHMISKPIFSTNDQGNFIGNFDKIFYTFLKENERLAKMDINIPSVNQFLIRRKDYFVEYNDTVKMILEKYNGVSLSFQKKLFKEDNELPLPFPKRQCIQSSRTWKGCSHLTLTEWGQVLSQAWLRLLGRTLTGLISLTSAWKT